MIKEIKSLIANLIINWPNTKIGYYLRLRFYSRNLKSVGENITIENGVLFGQLDKIEIGNNCIFGRNVNINAGDCHGVYIGNYVAIADGTYLRSANHNFGRLDIPIQNQGHYASKLDFNGTPYSIVIEDDVWIGARVIILSGAWIGRGCVISAGAVISNKIPEYSIVVGNPGRVVGSRRPKNKVA